MDRSAGGRPANTTPTATSNAVGQVGADAAYTATAAAYTNTWLTGPTGH